MLARFTVLVSGCVSVFVPILQNPALQTCLSQGEEIARAGTSPLYVFPNIFATEPSKDDVMGAMSLIFWILSIVVLLKYVAIVLHANDNGEGESLAWAASASPTHLGIPHFTCWALSLTVCSLALPE